MWTKMSPEEEDDENGSWTVDYGWAKKANDVKNTITKSEEKNCTVYALYMFYSTVKIVYLLYLLIEINILLIFFNLVAGP